MRKRSAAERMRLRSMAATCTRRGAAPSAAGRARNCRRGSIEDQFISEDLRLDGKTRIASELEEQSAFVYAGSQIEFEETHRWRTCVSDRRDEGVAKQEVNQPSLAAWMEKGNETRAVEAETCDVAALPRVAPDTSESRLSAVEVPACLRLMMWSI